MSHKRTGRLPAAVVGFWLIVHGLKRDRHLRVAVPAQAERVASAVERAVKTSQPKVRLNRSLAALRREHPDLFLRVRTWLWRPEVHKLFSTRGHSPAWRWWVEGARRLQEDEQPSQALWARRVVKRGRIREIKAGRPRQMEFSVGHDAGVFAEYLAQVCGVQSERATEKTIEYFGQKKGVELDRREVQRWRRRIRATKPKIRRKIKNKELRKWLSDEYKSMLLMQCELIAQKDYRQK